MIRRRIVFAAGLLIVIGAIAAHYFDVKAEAARDQDRASAALPGPDGKAEPRHSGPAQHRAANAMAQDHAKSPTAPIDQVAESLLASARTVDSKESVTPTGDHVRESLVEVPLKYPLLRVEETLGVDPATGAETVRDRKMAAADHIVVKIRPGATASDLEKINARFGARILKKMRGPNLYLVEIPGRTLDALPAAVADYSKESGTVAYSEPDYMVTINETIPNDPSFSQLYGLRNTGQTGGTPDADIDASDAWDAGTGSLAILVGVIDTGIDYTHEDLAANMWSNPGETGTDGLGHDKRSNAVDDDGNGFVDDWHGWDFVSEDNNPMDDHFHGTHVSGTIGGVGNNGIGVAGVNWHVSLVGLKFLNSGGSGFNSDAVDAVYYGTSIGVRLTSNSWGGGGFSQALYDAIEDANTHGILFVAAAGNSGLNTDVSPNYPSAYPNNNIVAVAATDDTDSKAGFSNYGAVTVDLGAPGVNTYSSMPGNSYGNLSGTSMATPHVSGALALIWSLNLDLSHVDLKQALLDGVDLVPSMSGITVTGGRLNVAKALALLGIRVTDSSPAANEIVFATPTNFLITFSDAYTPASVNATDLTVNGISPSSFALTSSNSIRFQYAVSPVSTQGAQVMSMSDDALTRLSDGHGLNAWTAIFRYDQLAMQVVSTIPADGSSVSLPMTSVLLDLNEPVDPATVSASDLVIGQGTVVTSSVIDPDTIAFTLTNVVNDEEMSISVSAAAFADTNGNPNLAYSGSFNLDATTSAFPVPLQPRNPEGSLVYDGAAAGRISFAGDSDAFRLAVDDGNTLTVIAVPSPTLQLSLEVVSPLGVSLTNVIAGPGEAAIVQSVPVAQAGMHILAVTGQGASTGTYQLVAMVNAAAEAESYGAGSNDSFAAAQDIAGSFRTLLGRGQRGAVVGALPTSPSSSEDWYKFQLAAGDRVTLASSGTATNLGLYNGGGALLVAGTGGYANVDRVVGGYVAPGSGDYLARLSGSGSYGLVITRNMNFDLEPNNTSSNAQDLGVSPIALGAVTRNVTDGLWLYYAFDTNEGARVTDLSGNGHTGIVNGASFVTNGIRGSSYHYDGINDYILAGPLGIVSNGTIAFWMNADVVQDHRNPLSTDFASGDDCIRFEEDTSGRFTSGLGFSATNTEYTLSLQSGTWYHVALTWNQDHAWGYLNGQLKFVQSHSGVYPPGIDRNLKNVAVGNGYSLASERFWKGYVDEVRVYTRILNDSDIASLAGTGAGSDFYRYQAATGTVLQVRTITPSDGPHEFINALDPAVELFNPAGTLVATNNNGAQDGRNVYLSYTTTAAGAYSIRVLTEGESGEYVLGVNVEQLAVTLPAQATEGDGVLVNAGQVSIPAARSNQLDVTLLSDDTSEITVPSLVSIPAGQTSVTFNVTIEDDSLFDGPRVAHVSASSLDLSAGTAAMTVNDNENDALTVDLPESGTEGDGLVQTGQVSVANAVDADVTVTLSNSDPSEATVPGSVVILDGQTSATFAVSIVNDFLIDGDQLVTVTAVVSNWTAGADSLTVHDNEDTALRITIPAAVTEGDSAISNAGRVAISGSLPSNLVVSLDSSDTTEITVAPTATILAGQTSVTFSVTVVNDAEEDGMQTAVVSVAAAGFTSASNAIAVADDDVNHFTWSAIANPQPLGVAFPATLTARTIDDLVARGFTSSVSLHGAGDTGTVTVIPASAGPFAAGLHSTNIAVLSLGSNVVLSANDGSGHSGNSTAFDVLSIQTGFTNLNSTLAGVSDASVSWGDYDSDQDPDLLLTGDQGTSRISRIYQATSLVDTGLILYYAFDVNEGTKVTDLSGKGHTGAVNNGTAFVTNGYRGSAYHFDGTNDYILVGPLGVVSNGTITFWMNSDVVDGPRNPLSTDYASGDDCIRFEEGPPNVFAVGLGFSGTNTFYTTNLQVATWYHVTLTWNQDHAWGYLNGQLRFVQSHSGVYPPGMERNLKNVAVGNGYSTDPGRYWRGYVDEVRVYNRTLTSNEVEKVYFGTDAPPDPFRLVDSGITLPGVSDGAGVWGDYDNDNDLDILLTGCSSTGPLTRIYRNDNGSFVDSGIVLPAVSNSSAAWGDYNNDGRLDILLTGQSATSRVTRVFRGGPQAAPAVSTNNLMLYYSFNTNSGTIVLDDSGHANTGTVSGATFITNGYTGGGYSFDGNDRINIGDASFVEGQAALTLGAWIRPTNSQLSGIIGKTETGDEVLLLDVGPSAELGGEIYRSDHSAVNVQDLGHLKTGQWQHVMATYDGTQMRLYYNGSLVSTSAVVAPLPTRNNAVGMAVGDSSTTRGWYFKGQIDEVRMYQRALSSNEVQSLYAGIISTSTVPFVDAGVSLPGISDGSGTWADYDGDGDLDILLVGQSDTSRVSAIWRNDGGGVFTPALALPDALSDSDAAWGDYDADGDLDIALIGDSGIAPTTEILRNDGGSFTNVATDLPGVRNGSAAWGDFDADGDLDLMLTGAQQDSTPLFRCYQNNGTNGFTNVGAFGFGVSGGGAAWADIDRDGDLDFAVAGLSAFPLAAAYRNNGGTTNQLPTAPFGLGAVITNDTAILNWRAPTDTETPSAALGYTIRVGSTTNGTEIVSPMAHGNGYRKLNQYAFIHHTTNWTLKGLTPGTRYVAVQAVDSAMAGSPFSTNMAFTIPDQFTVLLPPLVTEGAGLLTNVARLVTKAPAASNIVVSLFSSDTTEVSVAASVVLPVGQTSVTFNITVVDDPDTDGSQIAWITAAAASFVSGSNSLIVADNDLHHFLWSPIATPQPRNVPIGVSIAAKTIDDQTIPGFTGQVFLTCNAASGAVAITPDMTGPFVLGVWTGGIVVGTIEANAQISADLGITTGLSDLFDVVGPLISISPLQVTNVIVTAGDISNVAVRISNLGNAGMMYTAVYFQTVCICSDVVARYSFSMDNGAVTLDESANNITGTLFGATYAASGYQGGGMAFDGTNDYVQLPDRSVLRPPQIAVSAWVKATHTYSNGSGVFFSKEQTGFAAGYSLRYSGGRLEFMAAETGAYRVVGAPFTLQSSQWYNVVGSYDGQWERIFVNGVVLAESNRVLQLRHTTTQPRLGGSPDGSVTNFFHGLLDDVRVYGRGLSTGEVGQLFLGVRPVSWLSLAPASGNVGAGGFSDIILTFSTTGLVAGARDSAILIVTSDDLTSPSNTIPLAITVRPPPPVMVPEPAYTIGLFNLVSWLAAPGADQYWAESATAIDASPFESSGWISALSNNFSGLSDGTVYYYRARAAASSVPSDWSAWTSSRQLFPDSDWDGDGIDNNSEYLADTIPTNPASNLRLIEFRFDGTNKSVWWQGGTGVVQYLDHAPQIDGNWQPIYTNAPPTSVTNNLPLPIDGSDGYLRIRTAR